MKLEQLMEGVPYTLVQGSPETEINDIIYDSRKAAPGLLFVCIVGTQRDSHEFAADCAAKGVSALVIQHDIDLTAVPGVTVVKVESSRYAMALMSANLFGNPSRKMTMIGVTGTKGKTTTTHMIKSVLEAAGRKVGIALQMQDGSTRVLRMSHALEQHLQQEWTPYLLANAADIRPDEVLRALVYQDNRSIPLTSLLEKALGDSTTALLGERAAPDLLRLTPRTVSGAEMLQAVCTPVGIAPENVLVLAGSMPMLELVRAASRSAAAADAPAELRLAAKQVTLTDAAGGAAVEVLYRMVRDAEKLA